MKLLTSIIIICVLKQANFSLKQTDSAPLNSYWSYSEAKRKYFFQNVDDAEFSKCEASVCSSTFMIERNMNYSIIFPKQNCFNHFRLQIKLVTIVFRILFETPHSPMTFVFSTFSTFKFFSFSFDALNILIHNWVKI